MADDGKVQVLVKQQDDVLATDELELNFEPGMAVCGIEVMDAALAADK